MGCCVERQREVPADRAQSHSLGGRARARSLETGREREPVNLNLLVGLGWPPAQWLELRWQAAAWRELNGTVVSVQIDHSD